MVENCLIELNKSAANYVPLNPLSFIKRTAAVYPGHLSIIYGDRRFTWLETYTRARRLASALIAAGVQPGDRVAVMAANTPEMYEAHFGVPMASAVLSTLNCRLDSAAIAFILKHSQARVLITDREFSNTIKAALSGLVTPPKVFDIDDPEVTGGELLGECDYEALLQRGDPEFDWPMIRDEWESIALNYTSGTTGDPKGVVYHYRGAYLNALSNAVDWNMNMHPVYLWTLPMFHCNGWCFPWTIAAKAGVNVCIRKVSAETIYSAIAEHRVDHFCGAPIVLSFVINATDKERREFSHRCKAMTAAAPPPASVLKSMQEQGFHVTHVYGLTETYGPSVVCAWHREWDEEPIKDQAVLKARQGVVYTAQEELMVADPASMEPVPSDGETIGEVFIRGNITMKGYFNDPDATEKAFAGGWFHTGDLGVRHPDGYIKLKDRSKDIIISGGENISSIEVEDVIHSHPAVQAVAVVAKPDDKWGETPCAFIETVPGTSVSEAEIIAYCRENLAHFKCPRSVIFAEIPKTSTGKIQKFELRKRFFEG
ncbi:MAG: acyl-CoA synthetase [Gammaproteobacteria bacterium]|nr:acyl-CoA synthetase [Gammaproteobacteria bacterium]MCP5418273.1 acyl-CoA synthetase [Chromatiaceae bacterium]